MNITAERKRHFGAVIGSTEYRDEYVKDLVKYWDNQQITLSTIAETQPQAACLAFANGFKSKLNYFLTTIPNICYLLLPLERTIRNKFITAITGCHICSDKERVLSTNQIIVIAIFFETTETEFIFQLYQ